MGAPRFYGQRRVTQLALGVVTRALIVRRETRIVPGLAVVAVVDWGTEGRYYYVLEARRTCPPPGCDLARPAHSRLAARQSVCQQTPPSLYLSRSLPMG